jgi:hypothetical protein
MIKALVIFSSVLLISGCSQKPWDIDNDYEAGYDAGYIKGLSAGHDQEKNPQDTIPGWGNHNGNTADSIGKNLNDTTGSGMPVYRQEDSLPGAIFDSILIRENNHRIYGEGDILQRQDPAEIYPAAQEEKTGFFSTGFNLYIIIILLLLTVIILQLLNLRRKSLEIYGNTKILKDIAKSQRITKNIDIISNRLTRIESEIIRISAGRNDLNNQVIDNPPRETNALNDDAPSLVSQKAYIADSNNNPVIFFMPSPDNDGNFDNKKKSDHFIPSESIYQFIMNENSDKTAKFYIYQDSNNMERAINYYSSILEKVCKSENAFNPTGKSIVTLEPGLAVLTGNKWVVKEKALVKYE